MPHSSRHLTIEDCARHCHDSVLGGALEPDAKDRQRVGIELEWLSGTDDLDRLGLDAATAVIDALSPFPSGSRLTLEPGGQVELSSAPGTSFDDVCDITANELNQLDRLCAARGVALVALGADPLRPPERVLEHPRYEAMQHYFDATGPAGRTMMHNTASIQVNIGLGRPDETDDRWQVANRIGPILVASFANSALSAGRPSGWVSTRLQAWWALEPSRSGPVPLDRSPAEAWLGYALDARVAFVRAAPDHYEALADEPLTFRDWIEHGHRSGWPTLEDFTYHLTTLFPPVRPRGWFELRYLDALPTPFWMVAAAVAFALVTDPVARAEITAHLDRTDTDALWVDAAQLGLGHPTLGAAAPEAFAIARAALPRVGIGEAVAELVDSYVDRWVSRGRCPADDRLDAWRADGELFPPRESPVPYGRDVPSNAP